MKILAIDPGFERLGVAVLQNNEVLFSDCFKTKSNLPFPERLFLIGQEIERLIAKYQPRVLAIENLFLSTNQKTAMRVAETRGVIIYTAQKYGLLIKEFTPLEVKIAVTGYGKAEKTAVAGMVKKLLKIKAEIRSDDEFDALAIGLTAAAIK
jgi:crossover junction endodeoxyribonuclease RuvC